MRSPRTINLDEKHARRINQELIRLSEPPMILPFEHLIAKHEFDSGSYDHMGKAITLILTGLAILFAGGSLASKEPSIGYLVFWGIGVVLAGLIGLTLLSSSLRAKRAAIAVYKQRHP
ncbi:hypothetical protein AOZ07_01580 [Glutamicibacter halophytocola]|uniref:hypothetical protein n=1 Tax=Glutamicibacter halophytocola TaxID=1933880 RepID=UPI0006D4AD59|nr:hypothetical protein [Glutamicibacter halophytocola]ALG27818.1 hypothetical protein AOZ07_01580 [Glutamicibacter halophytocola]